MNLILNKNQLLIFSFTILATILIVTITSINNVFIFLPLGILFFLAMCFSHKLYQFCLFSIFSAYMILNYGISNIGINFGSFLFPLSEGVLLVGLIRMVLFLLTEKRSNKNFFREFIYEKYLNGFLILILIFLLRVPLNFYLYGTIVLRDGTHYFDMLYFIVVYNEILIMKKKGYHFKFLYKYIKISLNFLFFYSIFMVNPEILKSISPVYGGLQKESITLLGYFSSTHIWLLLLIMWNVYHIIYIKKNSLIIFLLHFQNIIALSLIGYSTSRITILTYLFLIIFTLIIKKSKVSFYLFLYLVIGMIFVLFVSILAIPIKVHRGTLNIELLYNMALSIFGQGEHEGMAEGSKMRATWIKELIIGSLNFKEFLIGKGFGMPLIQFGVEDGVIVREPHCSPISVYIRTGIIGFAIWISTLWTIFFINVKRYFKNGKNLFAYLSMLLIIIGFLNGCTETFFEQPYEAIPFYGLLAIFVFLSNDYENNSFKEVPVCDKK